MSHGIVDVFAFQEALVMEAVFGISILTMIWVGFRRWLAHKERMGRLIADQTAERTAQYGAHLERVEARLDALERTASPQALSAADQIEALSANPLQDRP